jgi:hypothetical protein
VQPLNEDFDKADAAYADILDSIANYQTEQQQLTGAQTKPPSYAEQRAAAKEGFEWVELEDGSWSMEEKPPEEWSDDEQNQGRKMYNNVKAMLEYADSSVTGLGPLYGTMQGGKWVTGTIPGINSQRLAKARTALTWLTNNLQLDEVGRIKGQGQVSNMERMILAQAASVINNDKADPESVKVALQEIEAILAGKLGVESTEGQKLQDASSSSYIPPDVTNKQQTQTIFNAASEVDKYW